ncbi:hypothetical protein ACFYKX_09640 [Cytobacillus sp. FJAT-54145]|uniref:Uncharacterized protein n=1 Tax=Cytobacillus spartinae TaxID=3299023 RepID=A0ABW6KDV7_9BACI
MDKKLVEEITRLVLERINDYEKQPQYTLPLNESELSDWNHLHSHKREGSTSSQYSTPLSEEELKDWGRISSFSKELVDKRETSGQTNKVRFSKVVG